MIKSLILRALPHVAAIGIFIILACAFLHPIFDDFVLNQGDIRTFTGMSKEIIDARDTLGEEPLWTNSMFGGMPAWQIAAKHPGNWVKTIDRIIKLGLPRGIDLLFVAMLGFYILLQCLRVNPWLSIPIAAVYGLGSIFILYFGAGHTSKVYALAYMAPALGGVFLTLRGKLWLGAGLTALFGSLHLAANHLQMTYYFLFLLAAVGIAELVRLVLDKKVVYAAQAAGMLVVAGILAVLPNMGNILTTYEYSAYSTRGKSELTITAPGKETAAAEDGLDPAYMLEYSMARGEFWSFMIPDVKGGKSAYLGDDKDALAGVKGEMRHVLAQQMRYWGDQSSTGGAFYIGVLICLFFFLWYFVPGQWPLKVALALLAVVVVMLSWRYPNGLGNFFIDSFPLYNKFRDTKMILVLLMLVLPLGAALFLDDLVKGNILSGHRKFLFIGSGAMVAILGLFLLAPGSFFSFSNAAESQMFDYYLEQSAENPEQEDFIYAIMDELPVARQKIFAADTQRALLLVLLGVAGLVLVLMRWLKPVIVIPVLGLVMLIDIWSVDRRYLSTDNPRKNPSWIASAQMEFPFAPTTADMDILTKESQGTPGLLDKIEAASSKVKKGKNAEARQAAAAFGVLGLNTNYRVLTMQNPFSEASIAYFHKSVGGYHGAKIKRYQELIDHCLLPEMQQLAADAQAVGLPGAFAKAQTLGMLNTRYVIPNPDAAPLQNPSAMGNAWFVLGVLWAEDADDEMETLADADLHTQAVIDQRMADVLTEPAAVDSMASVLMEHYKPNELTYRTSSDADGLVVFSEIFYDKGWNCYLDGQLVPHGRANYVLRAVNVPRGEHEVVFRFEPATYRTGNSIAHAGSALLLLLLAFGFWKERKAITAA